MKQYQVTWGTESAVVTAADENEAWSRFAETSTHAARHPREHERTIVEFEPVDTEPAKKAKK